MILNPPPISLVPDEKKWGTNFNPSFVSLFKIWTLKVLLYGAPKPAPALFLMPYKSYSLPSFSVHHSSYHFLSASLKFQTIEQKVVDRILWHWQGTIVITASSPSWLQMTPMERTRLTSMGGRHTTTILTTPSQIPKVLFKWGLLKIR